MSCSARVLVVGAGSSGLGATRQLLAAGHDVVLVETRSGPGGFWSTPLEPHHEDFGPPPESTKDSYYYEAGVYEGLILNTPKQMTTYSDFPMPADWPEFITYNKFHEYFIEYFKRFDLQKVTRFGVKATGLTWLPDLGKWQVVFRKVGEQNGLGERQLFDFVCSAIGPYSNPIVIKAEDFLPKGITFNGPVYHTAQIRRHSGMAGKRILILGGGNSAGENASLSLKGGAAKIHWIPTRRPKLINNYLYDRFEMTSQVRNVKAPPSDARSYKYLLSRWWLYFPRLFYKKLDSRFLFKFRRGNDRPFNCIYDMVSLCVTLPVLEGIKNGSVIVYDDMQSFLQEISCTGKLDDSIDLVINAYGFHRANIPFIEGVVPKEEQVELPLWNAFIPLDERLPNFALLYSLNTFGPGFVLVEQISRWLAQNLKNGSYHSRRKALMEEFQRKNVKMDAVQLFGDPKKQSPYVLSDTIAKDAGFFPKLWSRIFFGRNWSEWQLGWSMVLGPFSFLQFKVDANDPIIKNRLVQDAKQCYGRFKLNFLCGLGGLFQTVFIKPHLYT